MIEDVLPAIGASRRHFHLLHWRLPLLSGDHAATVRAETNKHNAFGLVTFPNELAEIDRAIVDHVRVAGITDVCVMCPHNGFGLWPVMMHQALQRLGHVTVADVP